MADFPAFFAETSVLPAGVRTPADRTDWERARLSQPDERVAGWLHQAAGDTDEDVWLVRGLQPGDELLRVGNEELAATDPPPPAAGASTPAYEGPDSIAIYRPWHFHAPDWGIEIVGPTFWDHVHGRIRTFERPVGVPSLAPTEVADAVLEWVLSHERFHFQVEVLAAQYEALERRSLYREYLLARFAPPCPWTEGSIEELLATEHESYGGDRWWQTSWRRSWHERLPAEAVPKVWQWLGDAWEHWAKQAPAATGTTSTPEMTTSDPCLKARL